MGVTTRKRTAVAAADQEIASATKRSRIAATSPNGEVGGRSVSAASPGSEPGSRSKQAARVAPKKGSRGAAFLTAAGISVPAATSPPKLSTQEESASKAARRAVDEAVARRSGPRSAARNPLLQQELPRKLAALADMFAGLQNVHEVMRKRGQRTTYQNMRQAVEEASGRRFLMSHLAQLRHLMPEALALEWVRLSVAAHSSRTEPHLLVSLNTAAAAAAAAQSGAVPAAAADGEMQAARRLLHCRLAAHLLDSYREHLGARAARLRQAGDAAAAEPLEAAAAAAEEPPVAQFVPPYPEDATDVPQEQLPPRPEAQVAARSPAILPSAGPAAAAQRLDVPATPATAGLAPPPSTGRTGRPPMHPSTVARQAHKQRRLSFSQAGLAAAGELSRAATVPASTLAASAARGQVTGRATKPGTPLDKLHSQLASPAAQQHATPARGLLDERPQQTSGAAAELHPKQAALAAALAPEDLQFGACLPDALDAQAQADAALLAGMPEQLRRLSTDGIISMDTLRKLEVAEQEHRRLSSHEARERRDSNAALGQLPRTFSRLQRIFGVQGPNALKLREVVQRIRQGGAETSSAADVEAQLRALALHAPEYLTLKPYGSCGTPALWVNRRADSAAVAARLRQVAEARLAPLEGGPA